MKTLITFKFQDSYKTGNCYMLSEYSGERFFSFFLKSFTIVAGKERRGCCVIKC